MKKLTLSVLAGALAFVGVAKADTDSLARSIALAQIQVSLLDGNPAANVINWKVGEYQNYSLSLMGMPLGTMDKTATSEEGNALWVTQKMEGAMIGNQVVEILLDRADGKVLKMKQNGKDAEIPDDKLEIIDQDTTTITVPAGTFECIHIKAKSEKSGNVEVWANPRDISLDGTAKMTAEAQGMPIAIELTKFGGR